MICFPHAKINIGLNVVEKRNDGFHNIETVFYPITISDSLEVVENEKFEFSNIGLKVDSTPENNLCVKAYNLLKKDFSLPPVKLILQKNIPFGAGLGGGSSDAAFTIKLLNDFFNLHLGSEQMQQYARRLGSDCAFFIDGEPVYAYNKGDMFEDISLSLNRKILILVKPNVHVSTAQAYSAIQPQPSKFDLRKLETLKIEDWKDCVVNDFEKSVFAIHPQLAKIKQDLYDIGALYAAMSGSGSSIYGIFDSNIEISSLWKESYVKKLVLE